MDADKKVDQDQAKSDHSDKGIQMPNIYDDIKWNPDTELEYESENSVDEDTGFNPYDTAVLRKN